MPVGREWYESVDRLFGGTMYRRLGTDVAYSVRVDLSTGKVVLVAGKDLDNPEVQLEFLPEAAKKLSEDLLRAYGILTV